MAKPAKFQTVLTASPIEAGWHYITVPLKIGEKFPRNRGSRRVICTINEVESFPAALLPYDGEFTIVVNKERRNRLGILAGDKVSVEIAADESEYGMPMPEELQEVLNQDPDGRTAFQALTPGRQRSMMYYIGKLKDIDKRIHASLILLDHLKRNNGKIVHDQLSAELRRPAQF
ncbi:MAG TPA: YdeI/OmpD-associated family protein [Pyrinomonadaceae bacterium]|nr:YdeI/OmpD-associated family protein [Pyrinomonadaceae bacterium]